MKQLEFDFDNPRRNLENKLNLLPPYSNKMDVRTILKWTVPIITQQSSECMLAIMQESAKRGINWDNIPRKTISEFFSAVFAMQAAKILTMYCGFPVTAGKRDNDCDVYFTAIDKTLEIKVSYADRPNDADWRGGTHSKRYGDFLLISRYGDDFKQFYAAHVNLAIDDWIGGEKNYYGTWFKKAQLIKKDRLDIMGRVYQGDRWIIVEREAV